MTAFFPSMRGCFPCMSGAVELAGAGMPATTAPISTSDAAMQVERLFLPESTSLITLRLIMRAFTVLCLQRDAFQIERPLRD